MKCALIIILVLALILFIVILLLKKISVKEEFKMPNIKEVKNLEYINPNPSIEIILTNYRKYQFNIQKSNINDPVSLTKTEDKRIKVCNNRKCIGFFPIKDYKDFNLILKCPHYFEAKIASFIPKGNIAKQISIYVKVKKNYSSKLYKKDPKYLSTIININSLFEVDQIIETSYGPSTILEVNEDYLVVDVPSLGRREIYNLKEIKL